MMRSSMSTISVLHECFVHNNETIKSNR